MMILSKNHMEVICLFNNQIKKEDAVAFFRFSVISPMLNAPKGHIDATAKKLAKTEFNDVINQKMVTFHYRTIYWYYVKKKYKLNREIFYLFFCLQIFLN